MLPPQPNDQFAGHASTQVSGQTPLPATSQTSGTAARTGFSLLGDGDLYLFNEGRHLRLYEKLGAHAQSGAEPTGCYFAVWAPTAEYVSVIGDFNGWNRGDNRLFARGTSGIWEGFVPGAHHGQRYKYFILSRYNGYKVEKADPLAFNSEISPKTASIIWDLSYDWHDGDWMRTRAKRNHLGAPMSIYEVHLGSFTGQRSYREIAPVLSAYVKDLGFTHVELLPVMEHPFYGSWGYQVTGYFAPTSRYGTPQELMALIDEFHRQGIGVILDWVPSHFPSDEHGLGFFDGTYLYEHQDPRLGFHPEWNSLIFNYSRREVASFLLSSAMFWLDRYHADGLRVDGVASMLYLDYGREPGQWVPNRLGGKENLAAVHFLQSLNADVYRLYPDVQTIAEESTAWPQVTRPTSSGGLGFGLKWDMGWMHDTLKYFGRDPLFRRYHHSELTFRMMYAHTENFVLALSHDEVVHQKGSLYQKMAGDDWQKRANLRLLLGYMYTQPGKKLLFMGAELAQHGEWNHEASLDWPAAESPGAVAAEAVRGGIQRFVAALNRVYREEAGLYELDYDPQGFVWLDPNDAGSSVLSFLRCGERPQDSLLVICNLTPVPRFGYRLGAPHSGAWREILNSDDDRYGGSGIKNPAPLLTEPLPYHGQPASLVATLPPLAIVIWKRCA
jgi:1,4-alpha-glucan branching enzyme